MHESLREANESLRNRERIRVRAQANTGVVERIDASVGFSSGDMPNDSGNVTLGDGFSTKPF